MNGPYSEGTVGISVPPSAHSWEARHNLIRGGRYEVVSNFDDADGNLHEIGESWLFLGGMFSKFDDMVTICVRLDDRGNWRIPLSWGPGGQGEVIEKIEQYVQCRKNWLFAGS